MSPRPFDPQANTLTITDDADLPARIAALEAELDSMTGEFVEQQEQLLALYDLTRVTRSQTQVDDILHAFTAEVRRLTQAEIASIVMDGTPPTVTHDPQPLMADQIVLDLFMRAQHLDRAFMLDHTGVEVLPRGVRSVLVVPVPIRSHVGAALLFANKPGGFQASDGKLACAIADLIGLHLEHALLHEEMLAQAKMRAEMELVQQMQLRLLPQHPPRVSGLEVYARSRPASQVGGDFYDFVATADRPLIFAVGDVTGKGVSAALIMAMTRTAIHSKARFAPDPSPALIMRRANQDLYNDLTEVSMFATAFIGQYEPEQAQIRFANAGHAPVIYCPRGGRARLLEADGPPMGVLPESITANQCVPFRSGDLLIAATDGLSEAHNHAMELFGIERLLALVEAHADHSAQAIAAVLFGAIEQFGAGHPQDDDQTLVVIKGI